MKIFSQVSRIMILVAAFAVAQVGFAAGSKTLIEMSGGKASAGIAKSWKKVKDGEYEFTLDPAAEIKKGTKVTPAMVKDSLEAKLGSSGVKVKEKGASAVTVTYTGDEAKFLDAVGKTKIRGGKDVELALESSTSEGGIRAKNANREPNAGEVKAVVQKVQGDMITAKVNATKATSVKANETIKIKGTVAGLKKNDNVFFIPEKKDGDHWLPKAGSLQ
jgi:hypothetical protein